MAVNVNDSFEVNENGIAITNDDGNVIGYLAVLNGDPTGSAAPINTFVFRQDNQLIYYKFGAGNNDWRQLRALDIAFNPVSNITATEVQSAIESHVGRHNPNGPDAIATGNVQTLTPDLANSEGTASSVARSDHIHKVPAEPAVTITTNGVNSKGNASSFARSNHTHKSEIYTESSAASNTVSTSSASDVLIPDMTLTPPAGDYLVSFDISVQRGQNDGQAFVSVYVGGAKQNPSERQFQTGKGGSGSNTIGTMSISEYPVTVNGSQAIEVRWRRAGGGGSVTSTAGRSLIIKRIE